MWWLPRIATPNGLASSCWSARPVSRPWLPRPDGAGSYCRRSFAARSWGRPWFNLLVTRVSLAGFLRRQVYADPDNVTAQLVDDYYMTGHQPGAKWVPAAFVSGGLNCNIGQPFQRLPNPVSLAWGRAATLTPVAQAEAFRASAARGNAGGLRACRLAATR